MRPYVGVAFTLAIVLTLTSAGCGGGSSPSAPSGGGNQPPPTTTGPVPIGIAGNMGAQSFSPNPASVDASRMVSWHNNDGVVHRIVSNDGAVDTGNIAPGATSAAVTLTSDGANYHCAIHPGMIGALNAASGTPPPCTGQYC